MEVRYIPGRSPMTQPLRVLINALSARDGGGQTYMVSLMSHTRAKNVRVALVAPKSLHDRLSGVEYDAVATSAILEVPIIRVFWETFFLSRLARKVCAEVIFVPGGVFAFPRGLKLPIVTMFRNMLPFADREVRRFPWGWIRIRLKILRRQILRSIQRADHVILLSESAKRALSQHLVTPLRDTSIVPHGVGQNFHLIQRGSARSRWIQHGEYVLYVSPLYPYKNQVEVVAGFAAFVGRTNATLRLVLVGGGLVTYRREVDKIIDVLGVRDRVQLIETIPHEDLPAVYANAQIVIFASTCENCPNILLEAMACGAPLACSNADPMPEFARDAPEYFDPSDPDSLDRALSRLYDSAENRAARGARARQIAQTHNWDHVAETTWASIARIAGRGDVKSRE